MLIVYMYTSHLHVHDCVRKSGICTYACTNTSAYACTSFMYMLCPCTCTLHNVTKICMYMYMAVIHCHALSILRNGIEQLTFTIPIRAEFTHSMFI